MNKTVSINLGGFSFHIDEDAYQKLSRYFDAIKRSLSPDGRDEIMNDIESRIAELLSEKLSNDKQVVSLTEIDQVIAVMGQPEDYRIEDESSTTTYTTYSPSGSKKLYRDKEKGMLGGVLAGMGHYFGVDPLWLRIIMVILLFTWGIGIIPYLLFWILVPEAKTTAEKLEMTGQPITISNIEKKVKEGFGEISDTISNIDQKKIADGARDGASKVATSIEDVFMTIFKVIAKLIGAFILIVSGCALIGIIIASVVMIFSSSLPDNAVLEHISTPIGIETPYWIQGLLLLSVVGIPLIFLIILGLKLLINNLRSIGTITKYSLLAIWLIATGFLITIGIREAGQLAFDGKMVQKADIQIANTDTLKVRFVNNDFFSKNVDKKTDLKIEQDSVGNEMIYSNNVSLHLKKTDKAFPYIQVEKIASGKSFPEANKRAEKIKYNFKIIGNQLILDNFLLTDVKNKIRGQKVEVYLYLPNGIVYAPEESVSNYLDGDNADFDYYYGPEGYNYKVTDGELKCLNCPEDEDADSEDEVLNISEKDQDTIKTVSIKVGGKEIIRTETKKSGDLSVDESGVVVKKK
ncbi:MULTISPECIES: PspC domain-containing protein [Flavobacterium]|uniref:PspC domain-containing protein n=1 Tax=Flavobacterium TaxID=237 RepID=UPI001FCB5B59|nr:MULTISPECIES: PspC domain-containing protein [Flavobacterium]UOK42381.1 PspC domain-containing protein [Flavobacterium enshiense]